MIAAARKERRMSQSELARRLGVSRLTIGAIEKGSPTVAIGTVFEAAVTLGIPLLAEDKKELDGLATSIAAITRVLPKRGRGKKQVVDDDF
jgi:transcriptional regulator with XRE-family HTH domain